MRLSVIFILLASFGLVACGAESHGDETTIEREVLSDDPTQSQDKEDQAAVEPEPLLLEDRKLEDAFDSFLAHGVPKIPLTRAFNFYRNNRASTGGLQDASCLIKPMSESGEIAKNSNRYDPTTLAMLKQGIRNERYMMIVDFTQSNMSSRGYLLDLQPDANGKFKVVKMHNAHGYGSAAVNGIPTVFTNASGKGTTVSGFFISAASTYSFYGSSGGNPYNSLGMRLYGLESTNNTAEKTSKVAHGAPYVSDTRAGNSAGCPAMKYSNAETYLPLLKGGILWYHHTSKNNSVDYQAPGC